jgi:hypothetical protein
MVDESDNSPNSPKEARGKREHTLNSCTQG